MKQLCLVAVTGLVGIAVCAAAVFAAPHPMEPQPTVITARESEPPSDAIVLFGSSDLSQWQKADGSPADWKVSGGVVSVGKGGIVTKREFGDIQFHCEFMSPTPPKGEGQGRGNSGLYFQGKYEVQVLDSYQNDTYINGMVGAIYENFPPLVNPSRPPGTWQTYDIIFRAPRFNALGNIIQKATLTVLLNGVLMQDHVQTGPTPGFMTDIETPTGPIFIQDHTNPVKFRNMWVRELK